MERKLKAHRAVSAIEMFANVAFSNWKYSAYIIGVINYLISTSNFGLQFVFLFFNIMYYYYIVQMYREKIYDSIIELEKFLPVSQYCLLICISSFPLFSQHTSGLKYRLEVGTKI